jgi:methionyl-tRNA synthetase
MISYEDFRKAELKIATIKDVVPHPQADRLNILTVDNGTTTKQVVAGIRLFYEPDKLKGRQVVLVDNLEPAVIRGVESQGMILAASDETGISAVMPDRYVKEGSIVK